jgi:hypothetical protein
VLYLEHPEMCNFNRKRRGIKKFHKRAKLMAFNAGAAVTPAQKT